MSSSTLVRTRFAPTPSGYLHIGNAWSFFLTWLLARSQAGKIHLRIDDLDAARYREEYLQDIFSSLQWLGLDWDTGPRSPAEFHSSFSQRLRRNAYYSALQSLCRKSCGEGPLVYACQCSREQVKFQAINMGRPGIYPGTCRNLNLPVVPAQLWQSGKGFQNPNKERALRLHIPNKTKVHLREWNSPQGENGTLEPASEMGDAILWQKNGEPSYQLGSVVDDESLGINLVVRGRDLRPSSGIQGYIAGLLGANTFLRATFFHHSLIHGPLGEKLSKSSGKQPLHESLTLQAFRAKPEGRKTLFGIFSNCLGLDAALSEPNQILTRFGEARLSPVDLLWADFL